jgi:DNA invertase Pin-like site-specific DNA recombinase
MTLAFSYQRFSSEKQKHGASIDRQRDAATRYAHTHDLVLDTSTYKDLGVSAFRSKNVQGALGAFIEAVDSKRIPKGSYLLIESLDRLSRADVPTALELFLSITNRGVVIVTLTEPPIVYSSATIKERWTDLIVAMTVMARANEESLTKSQRVSDAIRRREAEGKLRAPRLPTWLKFAPDRRSALIVPDPAKVVKQVFQWTIDGIGGREIARRLNDQGVKPFGKAPLWRQSAVAQLLHSHAAYGAFVPITGTSGSRTRGDPREGVYPAVVSKSDWIKAQQIIGARTLFKGGFGRNNPHNIFGGLSRCGHCGAVMRFLRAVNQKDKTKQNWYLRCSTSTDLARCEGRMFPFAASEAALVYEFAHRLDKHVGKDFFAQQNTRREELEHEIATNKERQRKLLKLSELTDVEAVADELKRLQAHIDSVSAELSTLSTFSTSKQEQHENAALFGIYLRFVDGELTDWDPYGDGTKDILEYRRKFKHILARTVKRIEFWNGKSEWKPQLLITYVTDARTTVDLTKYLPARTQVRMANGIEFQTHRGKRNAKQVKKTLSKKSG